MFLQVMNPIDEVDSNHTAANIYCPICPLCFLQLSGSGEKMTLTKRFRKQIGIPICLWPPPVKRLQTDANIDVTFYHLDIDVNITGTRITGNAYIELEACSQ
jgi:hypothetical protein